MTGLQANEKGSARLKLIIVLLVLGSIGYGLYRYVPVAYNASVFKDLMQHNVNVAVASGHPPKWVSDQLSKSLVEYGIPQDAVITPSTRDGRVEVRVKYTVPIEFPGYTYQYEFDHTARSTAFLNIK